MKTPSDSTSSASRSNEGAVDSSRDGSHAMPTDERELDARYPPNGDAGEGSGEGSGGDEKSGGESVPDPLLERLFGKSAAMPFDVAALKTGKAYWQISDDDRKLLADEAANAAKSVGVVVDRNSSPLLRLGLAYVAVGIAPAFAMLMERMAALEKKLDEKKPDDRTTAS